MTSFNAARAAVDVARFARIPGKSGELEQLESHVSSGKLSPAQANEVAGVLGLSLSESRAAELAKQGGSVGTQSYGASTQSAAPEPAIAFQSRHKTWNLVDVSKPLADGALFGNRCSVLLSRDVGGKYKQAFEGTLVGGPTLKDPNSAFLVKLDDGDTQPIPKELLAGLRVDPQQSKVRAGFEAKYATWKPADIDPIFGMPSKVSLLGQQAAVLFRDPENGFKETRLEGKVTDVPRYGVDDKLSYTLELKDGTTKTFDKSLLLDARIRI